MKKKSNQLKRIENVINNDRLNYGDNFYALLKIDIERLLSDYFDFSLPIALEIDKSGGNYIVNLQLKATTIKQFMSVPREEASLE